MKPSLSPPSRPQRLAEVLVVAADHRQVLRRRQYDVGVEGGSWANSRPTMASSKPVDGELNARGGRGWPCSRERCQP